MQVLETTWTSAGPLTQTVKTPRKDGEAEDVWSQRHLSAVNALKAARQIVQHPLESVGRRPPAGPDRRIEVEGPGISRARASLEELATRFPMDGFAEQAIGF